MKNSLTGTAGKMKTRYRCSLRTFFRFEDGERVGVGVGWVDTISRSLCRPYSPSPCRFLVEDSQLARAEILFAGTQENPTMVKNTFLRRFPQLF